MGDGAWRGLGAGAAGGGAGCGIVRVVLVANRTGAAGVRCPAAIVAMLPSTKAAGVVAPPTSGPPMLRLVSPAT